MKPSSPQSTENWNYKYSKRTLANGLTVVLVDRPHLHNASISAFVKTGSRFESRESNGISHFLEHMVFRGTSGHPTAYDLNLAFEKIGASINAGTTPDSTEYTVSLPGDSVPEALGLLSEMLLEPSFNEINTERKIITEEILEELDENGLPIDIDYLSRKRLWKNDPLGFSVTGTIPNVEKFTYGDLENWFTRNYTASNTILCIAGSIDNDSCIDRAATLFEKMKTGERQLFAQVTAGKPTESYLHGDKPGSQTQLRMAFPTPGLTDPMSPSLEIMLRLIDDGMSTPLHRRIFEDKGLAYNIGGNLEMYQDRGALNIDSTSSHDNVTKILKEFASIVKDIKNGNITREHLQKAKARARWDAIAIQDYPAMMNTWFGEQELFRNALTLQEDCESIESVGPEQISEAAHEIFKKDNAFTTTVGVQNERQLAVNEELTQTLCR